jgi:hypothetical protein
MLQVNGRPTGPSERTNGRYTGRRSLWSRIWEKGEFALAIAIVFTSPMNFLRVPAFYFTLSDALVCLCFLMLLRRGKLSLQPIGQAASFYWLVGLSMLLAGLVLSSIVYGDPLRGLVYAAQYFFAYFVLFLVIAGRSEKELVVLAKLYVFAIVLMCLHGAYLINIDGQRNTSFVSGSGRFTGFVERENECAALIALSVPILLYLLVDRSLTLLALLALPILGYGVMLTGSNTGLGAFVLAVGLFSALALNWKRLIPAVAAAAVAIVWAAHWGRDYMPAIFQRRVLGALEAGDLAQAGTFDHRVELIHEAIGWADRTILLGMGADQYAANSAVSQPVHNLYLLLWTEGGLLCMVGFIIMTVAGYGPALSALRRTQGRAVASCTISTVTIFLASVNAFPSVYGRFWSMPVILAIALACAFLQRGEQKTPPLLEKSAQRLAERSRFRHSGRNNERRFVTRPGKAK